MVSTYRRMTVYLGVEFMTIKITAPEKGNVLH